MPPPAPPVSQLDEQDALPAIINKSPEPILTLRLTVMSSPASRVRLLLFKLALMFSSIVMSRRAASCTLPDASTDSIRSAVILKLALPPSSKNTSRSSDSLNSLLFSMFWLASPETIVISRGSSNNRPLSPLFADRSTLPSNNRFSLPEISTNPPLPDSVPPRTVISPQK